VSAKPYLTIVETKAFIADAERCLTDAARDSIIEYIATNPTAGDLIRGTGGSGSYAGVRKAAENVVAHA